jgi:hypothetical protein
MTVIEKGTFNHPGDMDPTIPWDNMVDSVKIGNSLFRTAKLLGTVGITYGQWEENKSSFIPGRDPSVMPPQWLFDKVSHPLAREQLIRQANDFEYWRDNDPNFDPRGLGEN